MEAIEIDARTGEQAVIELSADEVSRLQARRAVQAIQSAKVVGARQARLALYQAELLGAVEAAVAAADKATQLTWEYAVEFRRDDPMIISIGGSLGLTDSQIDQLFVTASQL